MNFIKKTGALPCILLAAFIFTSCSKNTRQVKKQAVQITATFYPLYVMLLNITQGAQNTEISMIAPANTGCLHDYQLTTKDMARIEECDILVANGAGMEDFLQKALEQKKECTIIASEGYPLTDENPHIWVSPTGAIFQVKKIAQKLSQLDSKNSSLYLQNAAEYEQKLNALSQKMHKALDEFSGAKIITFHEAFPYFASEFNFEISAVIEREAGSAASAKEISQMIDLIKEERNKDEKIFLFAEPQYSSVEADIIARETGLNVNLLDPCVTGDLHKDAYITAMEKNCDVLYRAFTLE